MIDSFKTDKDGKYSFTYKYKGVFKGNSFELRATTSNKYYKRSGFETIGPTNHLIIDYNIEFIPKAWVKVHIKNVNPFGEFDFIGVGGLSNIASDYRFFGDKVDTLAKAERIGNDSLSIGWLVTKNNKSIFKTKKIYLVGHDTTFCELFY